MREIEVKAKVRNQQSLLELAAKLDIAFGKPQKQHDVVYGPPGFASGSNWLRIRTENDSKVYFTLKRSVTGELDSIEHEVVVDNAQELQAIIKNLGYQQFSDLTKFRQKARYGEIELCLDKLEGLGTFIEAELLFDDHNADQAAASSKLWSLLEELGISRDDQETSGYDVLMRNVTQ